MNTPSALEGVARQLVQRGLPAGYAAHAAAELVDHYHDLQAQLRATGVGDETASAEALVRLGDSSTLVKNTVREYQRRHWCARWPLLSFVLAPIPALCLFWAAMAAILVGVGWLCQFLGIELTQVDGETSLFERSLVESMWGVDFLLGPILVMSLFAWLARRSGLSLAWGVVVGVQMALAVD